METCLRSEEDKLDQQKMISLSVTVTVKCYWYCFIHPKGSGMYLNIYLMFKRLW